MTTTASETISPMVVWPRRLRFALAVLLVWAGLHYVVDQTVLSRGLDRPVVVAVSESGWIAAPVVALVLWVGAFLATRIAGSRRGSTGLMVVGLSLTIWAAGGGTMGDWLRSSDHTATSGLYGSLLGEYFFLLICVAGVAWAAELAALGPKIADRAERGRCVRRTFACEPDAQPLGKGIAALIIIAATAAILMIPLMGPRAAETRHGQVYFAVAVAFAAGVLLARRLVGERHLMWYWLAPFVVGFVGAVVAAINPDLPPPYERLKVIPAWALVRPLPVEMVGVGLVVTTWMARAGHARRTDAETK